MGRTKDISIFDNLSPNEAYVLIDGNGLCWNATTIALKLYPDATGANREATIIWAVMERLGHIYRQYKTTRLIWAWEGKNSKRKELFPEYKGRRSLIIDENDPPHIRKAKEARYQLNAAVLELKPFWERLEKEIIPSFGFKNSIAIDGFEGDDVMAKICEQEKRRPILIFSDDGDMYQCISSNVGCLSVRGGRMANGAPNKPKLLDRKRFIKMFDIEPRQWADAKAIAGCKSDCVPGIPGVGMDTAIKYVQDPNKLRLKNGSKGAKLKAIEGNTELIAFTDKLVRLPFEGTPEIKIVPDELNYKAFQSLCISYKLSSLVGSELWNEFFNG